MWFGNLENDQSRLKKDPDFRKQVPPKNSSSLMARYHLKQRPTADNSPRENGIANRKKTLGLAGSHSAQIKCQHHQAGLETEPKAEAEEREAKEQLATVSEGRDERGRFQPAAVGETVIRQRGMKGLP